MTKKQMLDNLHNLPIEILERAYNIDPVVKRAQLRFSSEIKDLLSSHLTSREGDFYHYLFNEWKIAMEV